MVKALKGAVSQGRHGQGLQVQKFSGRWILLWQNQVSEGDRKLGLTSCQEKKQAVLFT